MKKSKCQIAQFLVKFLGQVVENGQLYPDPDKIEAIQKNVTPTNQTELRTITGVVGWLQKFIPNSAEHLELFNDILKERAEWLWTANHEQGSTKIKLTIEEILQLRVFALSLLVTIAADASPVGLGAVLLQQREPIFFASRKLTDNEQRLFLQVNRKLLGHGFCS